MKDIKIAIPARIFESDNIDAAIEMFNRKIIKSIADQLTKDQFIDFISDKVCSSGLIDKNNITIEERRFRLCDNTSFSKIDGLGSIKIGDNVEFITIKI